MLKQTTNVAVRVERTRLSISQADLAKSLGVDRVAVILMERYGWLPPEPMRKRIAKVLRSDVRTLFGKQIADLAAAR